MKADPKFHSAEVRNYAPAGPTANPVDPLALRALGQLSGVPDAQALSATAYKAVAFENVRMALTFVAPVTVLLAAGLSPLFFKVHFAGQLVEFSSAGLHNLQLVMLGVALWPALALARVLHRNITDALRANVNPEAVLLTTALTRMGLKAGDLTPEQVFSAQEASRKRAAQAKLEWDASVRASALAEAKRKDALRDRKAQTHYASAHYTGARQGNTSRAQDWDQDDMIRYNLNGTTPIMPGQQIDMEGHAAGTYNPSYGTDFD